MQKLNPSFGPDSVETDYRFKIQQLYHAQGIVPSRRQSPFNCAGLAALFSPCPCKDGHYDRGTWPYIGAHYGEITSNLLKEKVLFVAMDRGASLDMEEEPTFEDTQRNFRIGCETRHNPHMGGVSQIMEFLSGSPLATEYAHQFSLTNAVKCVKKTGNQTSTAKREMKHNCARHLKKEIEVFEPNILITQGVPPFERLDAMHSWRVEETFTDEFVSKSSGKMKIMTASVRTANSANFILVTTPHPAHNPWRYLNGTLPKCVSDALTLATKLHRNTLQ